MSQEALRRGFFFFLLDTFLQFFQAVVVLSPALEVFSGSWPVIIPSVLQKICMASCAES